MIVSPLAKPTCDTHPGFIRRENLVPVVAGWEADQRAHARFYQLERPVLRAGIGPEFQLSAVTGLPIFIEIENHSYNPIIRSRVTV